MIPHLMNCPHIGDGWCLDCMRTMIPRAEVADALAAYELAAQEAEAILGGEYGDHYGPLMEMLSKARGMTAALGLPAPTTDTHTCPPSP